MKLSSKLPAVAVASCAFIIASVPAAAAPKESYCSFITKTEDGKFQVMPQAGWSLISAQERDGQIEYPENVVGVSCLRAPMALVKDDAETLSQGKSITLSAPSNMMTIVRYEIVDGKIKWDVQSGQISKSQGKRIKRSVERVQELLEKT